VLESCYCSRTGAIEDREPVVTDDGRRALRCPEETCGNLKDLEWLAEDSRRAIFEEAERHGHPTAA